MKKRSYTITFSYDGVEGFGISPKYIEAESTKDAVRKLIEDQKDRGNKVTGIMNVFLVLKTPRHGWMSLTKGES